MTEQTKVSGLTRMNVRAIEETMRPLVQAGRIDVHKTYAVFKMGREAALAVVQDVITRTPGRSHPKASLYAVARKLAQTEPAPVDSESDAPVPDATPRTIDPAALFLTDLWFPNMFEERHMSNGTPYHACKVCGEPVARPNWEQHHGGHKADRANQIAERIRDRKENDMADKVKPIDQGIPKVYLNEDGSKFSPPGADAKLKRDLIAAIDGLDNPKGLHKFDPTEAAKILAARGWNDWLIKSRKSRESQASRKAAREQKAAQKAKEKATAKRSSSSTTATATTTAEAKPDPKPARRQTARSRRSR